MDDWLKHGEVDDDQPYHKKNKRIAVPVTPQLEQLINLFIQTYPSRRFSKTAVMKTFLEAGAKVWYNQNVKESGDETQAS